MELMTEKKKNSSTAKPENTPLQSYTPSQLNLTYIIY